MQNEKVLKDRFLKDNNKKESEMARPITPFRSVDNQRVISAIVLMAGIFMIFYTPSVLLFSIGIFKFTNNILGILLFLVSAFYLLKTLD